MAEVSHRKAAQARPRSPHLQIYRMRITMLMSIVHRITGAALYFGTLLLAWWLIALASGPGYYAFVTGLLAHPIGLVVLIGYTWALIHHMLGGIRHLIWDTGRGFDLATADVLCWLSLAGSLALTAAIWLVVLSLKGVL
jgi:succinate dehydrogenase / fumarate reductase cytochrome b subunit